MGRLRLLGLVPAVIGVVMIVVGGLRPDAAEVKLCSFAKTLFATLLAKTMFADSPVFAPVLDLPDACFHGAPVWAPYLVSAALIIVGLGVFFYPGDGKRDAARLSVKGPHFHQYPPRQRQTTHFCRVRIHNRGPAPANNVQIRLLNIEPRPKHASWTGDYPYPVARVGQPIAVPGGLIKRGGDEVFQVASGWKDSRGDYLAGLDTKSPFHNPTPIAPDERWQMTYEVTADNAEPVQFLLEMFVSGDAVAIKRKSARAARANV